MERLHNWRPQPQKIPKYSPCSRGTRGCQNFSLWAASLICVHPDPYRQHDLRMIVSACENDFVAVATSSSSLGKLHTCVLILYNVSGVIHRLTTFRYTGQKYQLVLRTGTRQFAPLCWPTSPTSAAVSLSLLFVILYFRKHPDSMCVFGHFRNACVGE